ncbi:hypothetical protein ACTXT7_017568 [Hymenolepis weldensis]
MKKWIEEMIGGWVCAYGPQINADADADADAYVETLQTIVVKPPRIDSLANGGRPLPPPSHPRLHHVFQQGLAPSP